MLLSPGFDAAIALCCVQAQEDADGVLSYRIAEDGMRIRVERKLGREAPFAGVASVGQSIFR